MISGSRKILGIQSTYSLTDNNYSRATPYVKIDGSFVIKINRKFIYQLSNLHFQLHASVSVKSSESTIEHRPTHVRVRVRVPSSHVLLQSDHSLHSVKAKASKQKFQA